MLRLLFEPTAHFSEKAILGNKGFTRFTRITRFTRFTRFTHV